MRKPFLITSVLILFASGFSNTVRAQKWGGYFGTGVFIRAMSSDEEPELLKALMPTGRPILSAEFFRHNVDNDNILQFGFMQFGCYSYLPVKKHHDLELAPSSNGSPRVNDCELTTYGIMGEARFSLVSPQLRNPLYTLYFGVSYGGGVAFTTVSDTLYSDGLLHSTTFPRKYRNGTATGSLFAALIYETEKLRYQVIAEGGGLGASLNDIPMAGLNIRFGVMIPFRHEESRMQAIASGDFE